MNPSEPLHVNEASFEQAVLQSPVPVLLDFWAPWCGPCKMLAPVLDEIAREHAGALRVVKVNTEDSPALAARYGVRSIPTLLFFANGEVKDTTVGLTSKQELLSRITALAA